MWPNAQTNPASNSTPPTTPPVTSPQNLGGLSASDSARVGLALTTFLFDSTAGVEIESFSAVFSATAMASASATTGAAGLAAPVVRMRPLALANGLVPDMAGRFTTVGGGATAGPD